MSRAEKAREKSYRASRLANTNRKLKRKRWRQRRMAAAARGAILVNISKSKLLRRVDLTIPPLGDLGRLLEDGRELLCF